VLLFEDETDLLLFPPLRAGWTKRGEQFRVPLSGWNAKRVIFGAINPATGHRLFWPRTRGRTADFEAFLCTIHQHYRAWPVAMLLDENSSHKSKGSQCTAAQLEIELLWLPKRSPELNPLEGLWGDGKDHVCADRQYATIEEEVDRFIHYLESLPSITALNKGGILSDGFWLNS
jgi:transposase